jgi:hypothetical protein
MSPNIVNFTVSPSTVRVHVLPAAPGTDESPVLRRLAVSWPYPCLLPTGLWCAARHRPCPS